MVAGGISKGATFVGQGIAKVSKKVKPKDEEEDNTEDAQKKAAIGVGGATANALGSIVSGVCESAKIIGSDVKEGAVEVKRHKEGDEAAKLTEQQFNMAGQATVGGIHAVSAVTTGTVTVAVKVGAAAATYDHDWKTLMDGAAWKSGWMSSQDNTLDPWTSKWFVLRASSLAMYKDDKEDPYKPTVFIPVLTIKAVEKVEFNVTKKKHSLKIVTKSGTQFLSTECTDLGSSHHLQSHAEELEEWVDVLTSLARVLQGIVHETPKD